MIRACLDFIFPPLCLACKERCETKVLCPDCWRLSQLPDPATRCRHCFQELDRRGNLCSQCREEKLLPVVRAFVFDAEAPAQLLNLELVDPMGAFAFLQWIELEWPLPDAIIPMPDPSSLSIGRVLAHFIDRPFVRALRRNGEYLAECLDEDQELLLFDTSNPLERLHKGALALFESLPQRVRILSLFD